MSALSIASSTQADGACRNDSCTTPVYETRRTPLRRAGRLASERTRSCLTFPAPLLLPSVLSHKTTRRVSSTSTARTSRRSSCGGRRTFLQHCGRCGPEEEPSTSELLDWLKLLLAKDSPAEALRAGQGHDPAAARGAAQERQDVHLFERVLHGAQRALTGAERERDPHATRGGSDAMAFRRDRSPPGTARGAGAACKGACGRTPRRRRPTASCGSSVHERSGAGARRGVDRHGAGDARQGRRAAVRHDPRGTSRRHRRQYALLQRRRR